MMFLIRFWRNQTKKDSVESAKYEIILLHLYSFLDIFFIDPVSRFLPDPDPDSGKKVRSGKSRIRKKTGSETLLTPP